MSMYYNLLLNIENVRDHHFISKHFNNDSIIIDLGAHKGEFSHYIKIKWLCRCIAVEADPELSILIKKTQIECHNYAISNLNSQIDFYINKNKEASSLSACEQNSLDKKIRIDSISLENLFLKLNINKCDLLKIDVEGIEIDILLNTPVNIFLKCNQISVEFHDSLIDSISRKDVKLIISKFEKLGFYYVSFSREYTDVLFINKNSKLINQLEYFYLKYLLRNIFGFGRAIGRIIRKII